jgi:CubicO group peptidase (beta-lactamase class C family)
MIVLHEAIGWRDKERRLPLDKDTAFQMASNTKPVVAAGVLMLSEQGKLKLDDNVRKYVASFNNPTFRISPRASFGFSSRHAVVRSIHLLIGGNRDLQ